MASDQDEQPTAPPPKKPATDRFFLIAENLLYGLIAILLVGSAVFVLGAVAYHLVVDMSDGIAEAVTEALDGLLLLFIVLELLAGVRAIMAEHQLVAEPFLLVGITASIKEIVLITLRARTEDGLDDPAFGGAMVEIGTLGLLVLALSVAAYLVRRKEREPQETDGKT